MSRFKSCSRLVTLFDRNFPSQSEALFTVAFLERLYLSGNAGPMHYKDTEALVSQVTCTRRFLLLTLDSSTNCVSKVLRLYMALDEITLTCGDHLILLSSNTPR